MSDHSCPVVPVTLSPHPNADKLAMVHNILGGFHCGVSKSQFSDVTKAAFIPPDSLVPVSHPEFAFLAGAAYAEPHPYAGHARITVKKFRGLYSDGLLVRVPDEMPIGFDAAEHFGVKHYEPVQDEDTRMSADAEGVDGFGDKYDIENLKRYVDTFAGRDVVATEKIHGCNARYQWKHDRMWCGSRSQWKKPGNNVWWASVTPEMTELLKDNEHLMLFGEVYGKVQKGFHYDAPADGQRFVAFDLRDTLRMEWLNHHEMVEICLRYGIPVVPTLYTGPFDLAALTALAEGPPVLGPGAPCREGVVVRSLLESSDAYLGRHILKIVGNGYLELK